MTTSQRLSSSIGYKGSQERDNENEISFTSLMMMMMLMSLVHFISELTLAANAATN